MFFLILSTFSFLHILFLGLSLLSGGGDGFLLMIDFCSLGSLKLDFAFLFDWVSCFFCSFVLFISLLVVLYRNFYIEGDLFLGRFMLVLVFFVMSIIFLVFRVSLFSVIVGWDGLGVVSFCLVIYYSDRVALVSGLLTIYTNRVGDIFIIFSIYFCSFGGGWFLWFDVWGDSFAAAVFIFLASLTKRAQYPFSSWLPAAISAPTPISALVHSSTLVTAGAYLVIRFNFLLSYWGVSSLVSFLSSLTMLLAGISACLETDLKKVVAISTLRQLGLIFFILSLGE